MRGAIHGIWLVKPGGFLHPAILPKFEAWAPIAAKEGFQIVLWTNIDQLAKGEVQRIQNANVIVGDPNACKGSPLFKYYEYFYKKGLKGDTTSFALASDVLRMAILDFTAPDKYFIYIDPNDIVLLDLQANLHNIDASMKNSTLGFLFPIVDLQNHPGVYDVRNDVLIALKQKNPQFFQDYLTVYWANLERSYKRYEKSAKVSDAQFYENIITSSTTPLFFLLQKDDKGLLNVAATFSGYTSSRDAMNSTRVLTSVRIIEHGNNWLPAEEAADQAEEIAANSRYMENLPKEQEELAAQLAAGIPLSRGPSSTLIAVYVGAGLGLLLCAAIVFRYFRNRSPRARG